jgi:hypothetical protein
VPKLAPRDRGPSCAGRPAASWSALRDPPLCPRRRGEPARASPGHGDETRPLHHATGTPSTLARHTRPPTSTTTAEHHRREDAFLRLAFRSRRRHRHYCLSRHARPGQTSPHPTVRDTEATPLPRTLPLPRQGPRNRHAWAGPTGLPGGSRKGVPCVSRGPPSSKAQAWSGKPPAGGAAACCSPGEQQPENNRSEQQVTRFSLCSPRLSAVSGEGVLIGKEQSGQTSGETCGGALAIQAGQRRAFVATRRPWR